VTLSEYQPEAVAALDATIARAREVVDPVLLDLVEQHIRHHVAEGPAPRAAQSAREEAVAAVVEQMLIDVAGMTDDAVRAADACFPEGGLPDLVMASYAIEARTRLEVASARLLGGLR
jgi:hypothetical protein